LYNKSSTENCFRLSCVLYNNNYEQLRLTNKQFAVSIQLSEKPGQFLYQLERPVNR